jgi:AraC family transcriptional regulator of adaptative response / DNA-3-methyladenine glycosylase II
LRNGSGTVRVEIDLPDLFDSDWLLRFLQMRAVPGIEVVRPNAYYRSLRFGEIALTVGIRFCSRPDNRRVMEVDLAGDMSTETVSQLVRKMFDLDAPIQAFLEQVAADDILGDLVARKPGIRLPVFGDPLEGIVRAVLGQQVSLRAAKTITARLVELYGKPAPRLDSNRFKLFPTPAALADVRPSDIQRIGLTRARAQTLSNVARAFVDGRIDPVLLCKESPETATKLLTSLPGIGPWTASYVRMRVLGDRDVFMSTDLGIKKVLARSIITEKAGSRQEVERLVMGWRPWRSYATLHLLSL